MELQLDSEGVRLRAFLVNPPTPGVATRGLVLCHGLPITDAPDTSYSELATLLATASGWSVLTFDYRRGPLALPGSLEDVRIAVDHLAGVDSIAGVWVAGFSVGAALALCVAGEREQVRGVAAFGAPAELDDWVPDPGDVRPLQLISKVPPRPVLLVHGDNDDVVPVSDARALADAAGGEVELRLLAGGSHGLRHDPRAIAVLEGWLDRQEA